VDKVIKDGYVAVIMSYGYGSGWSSWHTGDEDEYERMLFDPALVNLIGKRETAHGSDALEDADKKIELYCRLAYPDVFYPERLDVAWVPEGTKFLIYEHDGDEFMLSEEDLDIVA
jgi:hypothetical protein